MRDMFKKALDKAVDFGREAIDFGREAVAVANQAKLAILGGLSMAVVKVANAAPVDLPATAQADIEGSVTNGGNFYILTTLLILGFLIIGRMIKKA